MGGCFYRAEHVVASLDQPVRDHVVGDELTRGDEALADERLDTVSRRLAARTVDVESDDGSARLARLAQRLVEPGVGNPDGKAGDVLRNRRPDLVGLGGVAIAPILYVEFQARQGGSGLRPIQERYTERVAGDTLPVPQDGLTLDIAA